MAYQVNSKNFFADVAAKAGLQTNTTPVVSQDRKPSTDWLNIGMKFPGLKDENGNELVVTLPLGVAIDNMKVPNVGNSQIGACRKALVEKLQEMFAEMPEGTRVELPMLVVQAYKAPTSKPETQAQVDAKSAVDEAFAKLVLAPKPMPESSKVPEGDDDDSLPWKE